MTRRNFAEFQVAEIILIGLLISHYGLRQGKRETAHLDRLGPELLSQPPGRIVSPQPVKHFSESAIRFSPPPLCRMRLAQLFPMD